MAATKHSAEVGPTAARDLILRAATVTDLAAVQSIYAHHVRHGLGSFETGPPDMDEIETRWRAVTELSLPYLVAERGNRAVGFAYARPYRERAAYRHTVEDAVYVAPDQQRHGIGRILLQALIDHCSDLPLHQMIALIGNRENQASIELHRALGFRQVGVLAKVGRKFDRWVDVVIMQRALRPADGLG